MAITPDDMQYQADDITDLYSNLEEQILDKIISYATSGMNSVDKSNAIEWQIKQLSKMGMLTNDVIDLVSDNTGMAEKQIKQMVNGSGMQIDDETRNALSTMTGMPNINGNGQMLLNGIMHQTFRSLNNVVNQSLVTRNVQNNVALQAYQDIINKSTIETITGLKTHEKAIFDNIHKWADAGLKTNLVDRAGHKWSMEGYTRMVVNTTANRTFNDIRMNAMKDYNVTLAVMDAHPASRPACAPIQGKVINTVPPSDPQFNSKYDSLYNHGYGEPAGTKGINCHHNLFPYKEDVSTNPFTHPNTEEAIKKGNIQQRQREIERRIRHDKKMLHYSEEAGDKNGIQHHKEMLKSHRSFLRSYIKDHDFLRRDYSREKVFFGGHGGSKLGRTIIKPKVPAPKTVKPKAEPIKTVLDMDGKSIVKNSNFNNWYEKLSNEQKGILKDYYEGDAYDINATLRDKDFHLNNETKEYQDYIHNLDKTISSGKLVVNTKLYRFLEDVKSTSHLLSVKPGDVISDRAYMSTSTNQKGERFQPQQLFSKMQNRKLAVKMHGYSKENAKLVIDAPAGTRGASIQSFQDKLGVVANGAKEDEFLLPRNTKLKITKSEWQYDKNNPAYMPTMGEDNPRVKVIHAKIIPDKEPVNNNVHTNVLTAKEKGAITRYVSPDAYQFNEALRTGNATDQQLNQAVDLNNALDKLPKYKSNQPLQRSESFISKEALFDHLKGIKIGDTVSSGSFLSTSKAIYNPDDTLRIIINHSHSGADLGKFSPGEQEVLFKPDTKFKVTKGYVKDGKYYMEVDEID